GMAKFDWENVGGNQRMDGVAVRIAEADSLIRVNLRQDPLHAYRRVEDILHSVSRSSRMAGTPMSRMPCLRKTASLIRSIRSHASRILSGSRTFVIASRAASSISARSVTGMPVPPVSAEFIPV